MCVCDFSSLRNCIMHRLWGKTQRASRTRHIHGEFLLKNGRGGRVIRDGLALVRASIRANHDTRVNARGHEPCTKMWRIVAKAKSHCGPQGTAHGHIVVVTSSMQVIQVCTGIYAGGTASRFMKRDSTSLPRQSLQACKNAALELYGRFEMGGVLVYALPLPH